MTRHKIGSSHPQELCQLFSFAFGGKGQALSIQSGVMETSLKSCLLEVECQLHSFQETSHIEDVVYILLIKGSRL